MGQHYTASTVAVSAWCNRCNKNTPHRVADKRLQYCIPCFDRRPISTAPKPAQSAVEQLDLFGGKP